VVAGSVLARGRWPLQLTHADVSQAITGIADASVDAILHDPPRFGIAGELYSQAFYDQLARVSCAGAASCSTTPAVPTG
jgi:Predicted archaeal methyltransferase